MTQNEQSTVIAKVLWFNAAKGYGLVRAEDRLMDDIRVDSGVLDGEQQELMLQDVQVEVVVKETPTGLVADNVRFIRP